MSQAGATAPAEQAKPRGNPAFRAMGLPNFRLRLPSRNWMIFLSIVGSWTGALLYDRRQKKLVQQKWATLVSHIADETVPSNAMPRKVTIFLSAPPGDGLRVAREHFLEYVKPVLVAASLNWDVVEGRREGEVRAGLAERVRRLRRKQGETASSEFPLTVQDALENVRSRNGVIDAYQVAGDVVIGRNTWKEYVRGLHEGWLGPLDPPPPPPPPSTPVPVPQDASYSALDAEIASPEPAPSEPVTPETQSSAAVSSSPSDATPAGSPAEATEKPKEEEKPKPLVTAPFISPSDYSSADLPRSAPAEFGPSAPIAFPHLLGFRNTPIRMYRFLTRRYLADEVGRQTAAAVLAASRPFSESAGADSDMDRYEQQKELDKEESEWQKAAIKRDETKPEQEREWLDRIVLDQRIAERMRRFEVTPEDEDRAHRIGKSSQGIPGHKELSPLSDYED